MIRSTNEKLSSSLEDYLEVIFNLSKADSEARSKDIAEKLGVSRASVTGALKVLKSKGLANYQPYGCVTLTDSGHDAAAQVVRKHNILKSFFTKVLGVDPDVGQKAACKAEHTLGPAVIGRLMLFIRFVTEEDIEGYDLVGRFQQFCERESAK